MEEKTNEELLEAVLDGWGMFCDGGLFKSEGVVYNAAIKELGKRLGVSAEFITKYTATKFY